MMITAGTWVKSKCVSRSSPTCPKAVTIMPTSSSTPCSQRLESVSRLFPYLLSLSDSAGYTRAKCKGFGTGDAAPLPIECSRPLE
jgi:hypothetical protein